MLAESSVLGGNSATGGGGGTESAARGGGDADACGGVAANSGEDDKSDRSFGGNRWPREETVALIKIRSDMDATFREASSKGPLWEQVSRKLAELGYHRSAKKCKEKFENVYKYHKRTKEGRGGKPDGKAYRFFEHLEALESHHSPLPSSAPPSLPKPLPTAAPPTMSMPPPAADPTIVPIATTIPSTTAMFTQHMNITQSQPNVNLSSPVPSFPQPTINNPTANAAPQNANPSSFLNISTDFLSSSSMTSSDDEESGQRQKRKRKWKDFFDRLMKEVVEKQEELQKRFLEAVEKREQDRVNREEAWRMQEMMRINRERELLAQERSMAAAKDAAVLAFLQKISEQQTTGTLQINVQQPPKQQPPPQPQLIPPPQSTPPPTHQPSLQPQQVTTLPPPLPAPQPMPNLDITKTDHNNGNNSLPPSSSRWPKTEIEALINLRKNLDTKYQDNGPKGPLWEEISAGMRRLGYNRNAKRCKEKWENINKYYKKVKESNKKRPEDSKTCPYFHQLDALYKEKNKMEHFSKPDNTVPLMVQPEQQWPPQHHHQQQPSESALHEMDSENTDQNQDDEDEDDDEAGDQYEVVANKPPSVSTTGS